MLLKLPGLIYHPQYAIIQVTIGGDGFEKLFVPGSVLYAFDHIRRSSDSC